MRCESAASIKGRRKTKYKIPKAGTKLRKLYDLLMANKGQVVSYKLGRNTSVQQLSDFYGLDIRTISHGRNGSEICLVGEWFGKVYIDYLANKQEKGI